MRACACVHVRDSSNGERYHACVCVPMCLSSNMINTIGERVLDHVLHERVPKKHLQSRSPEHVFAESF